MKSELSSIIVNALLTIFILLVEPDINDILKMIVIVVITVIDCRYIYVTRHIDLEKRPEKLKTVKITGIALIVISGLFAIIEGRAIIEKYGRIRWNINFCWEFILSVVLIFQIYKTMRGFSNSLKAKNKTDWFYEKEDKQEEE